MGAEKVHLPPPSPGPGWIRAGPGLLAWDLFFFKPFVKEEEMAYHSCIGPGVGS